MRISHPEVDPAVKYFSSACVPEVLGQLAALFSAQALHMKGTATAEDGTGSDPKPLDSVAWMAHCQRRCWVIQPDPGRHMHEGDMCVVQCTPTYTCTHRTRHGDFAVAWWPGLGRLRGCWATSNPSVSTQDAVAATFGQHVFPRCRTLNVSHISAGRAQP